MKKKTPAKKTPKTPDSAEITGDAPSRADGDGERHEPEAADGTEMAEAVEIDPVVDEEQESRGETPVQETVPVDIALALEERARTAETRLAEFGAAFQKYKDEHQAIRARMERDQESRVQETLSRTFLEILGALDNLDRSLEHAEDGPLAEGVGLVHKQFMDILRAEGLERLDLVGKPFDPTKAEAVFASPVDDPEDANKVLEEFRPGYRLGDKVIRPAQVRVGRLV